MKQMKKVTKRKITCAASIDFFHSSACQSSTDSFFPAPQMNNSKYGGLSDADDVIKTMHSWSFGAVFVITVSSWSLCDLRRCV